MSPSADNGLNPTQVRNLREAASQSEGGRPVTHNFYDLLGVSRNAGDTEIQRAYRKLARIYHPDVNKDDQKSAEEIFKLLGMIYGRLKDQDGRDQYANELQYGQGGYQGAGSGYWGSYQNVRDVVEEAIYGRQRQTQVNRALELRMEFESCLQSGNPVAAVSAIANYAALYNVRMADETIVAIANSHIFRSAAFKNYKTSYDIFVAIAGMEGRRLEPMLLQRGGEPLQAIACNSIFSQIDRADPEISAVRVANEMSAWRSASPLLFESAKTKIAIVVRSVAQDCLSRGAVGRALELYSELGESVPDMGMVKKKTIDRLSACRSYQEVLNCIGGFSERWRGVIFQDADIRGTFLDIVGSTFADTRDDTENAVPALLTSSFIAFEELCPITDQERGRIAEAYLERKLPLRMRKELYGLAWQDAAQAPRTAPESQAAIIEGLQEKLNAWRKPQGELVPWLLCVTSPCSGEIIPGLKMPRPAIEEYLSSSSAHSRAAFETESEAFQRITSQLGVKGEEYLPNLLEPFVDRGLTAIPYGHLGSWQVILESLGENAPALMADKRIQQAFVRLAQSAGEDPENGFVKLRPWLEGMTPVVRRGVQTFFFISLLSTAAEKGYSAEQLCRDASDWFVEHHDDARVILANSAVKEKAGVMLERLCLENSDRAEQFAKVFGLETRHRELQETLKNPFTRISRKAQILAASIFGKTVPGA